jgi:hypothetical protein
MGVEATTLVFQDHPFNKILLYMIPIHTLSQELAHSHAYIFVSDAPLFHMQSAGTNVKSYFKKSYWNLIAFSIICCRAPA